MHMLKFQIYFFLLNFLLLMNRRCSLASSPDDYFGQAEAEYDYYEDEYFEGYEDVHNPETVSLNNDLVSEDLKNIKDTSPKEPVIIASKYIGEIDARGSTITIHDSGRRDQSYDKNKKHNIHAKDHIGDVDPEISSVSIESEEEIGSEVEVGSEEDMGREEKLENEEEIKSGEVIENKEEVEFEKEIAGAEEFKSEKDFDSDEDIKDREDSLTADSLVSEDDESENILPPIAIKKFGTEETFVDKLEGLQMGMDAMVIILKEIAEKVGCPLAKIQNDIPHCPAPFTALDSGECLYVDLEKRLTWSAARSACNKLGADLVYPLKHDQDLGFIMGLEQHIDVPKSTVWIGGSDRQHEGVWNWVDGSAVPTSLAWNPGQPRHISGREDCMALSFVEPKGLRASNCLIRKHYVCQKRMQLD